MQCKYVGGDIRKYLDECIIRYNGMPYYAAVSDNRVHLVDLETRSTVNIVNGDDPQLDISSIPLGWSNIQKNFCVYIKRHPYRRWKQGVSMSNITAFKLIPNSNFDEDFNKNSLLTKEFKDSVLGVFPSYDQAFKMVTSKQKCSVALSHNIAIMRDGKNINFYFSEDKIGELSLTEAKVVNITKNEYSWVAILELTKIKGIEIREI